MAQRAKYVITEMWQEVCKWRIFMSKDKQGQINTDKLSAHGVTLITLRCKKLRFAILPYAQEDIEIPRSICADFSFLSLPLVRA